MAEGPEKGRHLKSKSLATLSLDHSSLSLGLGAPGPGLGLSGESWVLDLLDLLEKGVVGQHA